MAFGEDRVLEIVLRARDEATRVIENAGRGITSSFEEAEKASNRFALGLLGAGTAAAGFIGYGAKIAGDLEASRQGFITLLGSATKANAAIEQIKKDAAATPFELPGLISANQLLTTVTNDAGKSEALLLNVGKALAAMGKGQPELDRVITNLQQIGATGRITELDIRQFGYAGIDILGLLADYYGVTKAAAGDMLKDSTNGFADLEGAFAKAGSAGGKFANAFKNQAGTFNQLVSNMHDSFNIFLADLVNQTGVFDMLKQAMSGLIDFMNEHGETIGAGIMQLLTFIRENGVVVAGIILGALTPAIIGFTASVVASTVALLPYIAAVTALALAAKFIVDHWSQIQPVLQPVIDWLMGTFTNVKANLDEFTTAIAPEFQAAWANISTAINNGLIIIQNVWSAVWPALRQIFMGVWQAIGGYFQLWWGIMQVAIATGLALMSGDWKKGWEGMKKGFEDIWAGIVNILQGAWNSITGVFRSNINGIVGMLNGFIDAINKAGGKTGNAAIAKLPTFDQGGWVPRTGPALVHAGEYVLSRDMLAGRQPIAAPVTNNSPINIGPVYVQSQGDVDTLAQRMAFMMKTSGKL